MGSYTPTYINHPLCRVYSDILVCFMRWEMGNHQRGVHTHTHTHRCRTLSALSSNLHFSTFKEGERRKRTIGAVRPEEKVEVCFKDIWCQSEGSVLVFVECASEMESYICVCQRAFWKTDVLKNKQTFANFNPYRSIISFVAKPIELPCCLQYIGCCLPSVSPSQRDEKDKDRIKGRGANITNKWKRKKHTSECQLWRRRRLINYSQIKHF